MLGLEKDFRLALRGGATRRWSPYTARALSPHRKPRRYPRKEALRLAAERRREVAAVVALEDRCQLAKPSKKVRIVRSVGFRRTRQELTLLAQETVLRLAI